MSDNTRNPADSESYCFRLKNVTKTYPSDTGALETPIKGLSVDIPWGSAVAVVGKSGTGKSTLLHLLGLLDTATGKDSDIRFNDGEGGICTFSPGVPGDGELSEEYLRRKLFGFVFQQGHLLRHLSAEENVSLPQLLGGRSKIRRTKISKELLKRVDLEKHADKNVRKLSGGESQRVAILRAISHDPRVVFADEPTGNLDPHNAESAMNLLNSWLRDQRHSKTRTLILVTHDLDIAYRYCDCFAILRDGSLFDDKLKWKSEGFRIEDLRASIGGNAASDTDQPEMAGADDKPESRSMLPANPQQSSTQVVQTEDEPESKGIRLTDWFFLGRKDLFGPGNLWMSVWTILTLSVILLCVTVGWGFFHGQKESLEKILSSSKARGYDVTSSMTRLASISQSEVDSLNQAKTSEGKNVFEQVEKGGVFRWNFALHEFYRGTLEDLDSDKLRTPGQTAGGRTVQIDDPWLAEIPLVDGRRAAFSSTNAEEIIVCDFFLKTICDVSSKTNFVLLQHDGSPVTLKVVGRVESPRDLKGNLYVLPDGLHQLLFSKIYKSNRLIRELRISPIPVPKADAIQLSLRTRLKTQGIELAEMTLQDRQLKIRFQNYHEMARLLSFVRPIIRQIWEEQSIDEPPFVEPPAADKTASSPTFAQATCYLTSVFFIDDAEAAVQKTGLSPLDPNQGHEARTLKNFFSPLERILTVFLFFLILLVTGNLSTLLSQRISQRQAEIGILKANGMTTGQIACLYSVQSGLMALVICVTGIGLGYGGGRLLCRIVGADASLFSLGWRYLSNLPVMIVVFSTVAGYLFASRLAKINAAQSVR